MGWGVNISIFGIPVTTFLQEWAVFAFALMEVYICIVYVPRDSSLVQHLPLHDRPVPHRHHDSSCYLVLVTQSVQLQTIYLV